MRWPWSRRKGPSDEALEATRRVDQALDEAGQRRRESQRLTNEIKRSDYWDVIVQETWRTRR